MRGKASPRPKVEPLRGITPAYAGKSAGMHAGMAAVGDHPRVCGEKLFIGFLPTFHPGSPPRVRGKAKNATLGGGKRGITPACAGKSLHKSTGLILARDHPRVCGEKSSAVVSPCPAVGSPPRVRGKGIGVLLQSGSVGITPACAGKSNRDQTILTTFEDHPRVCGEKLRLCEFLLSSLGSPPRVRGKAASACLTSFQTGITPACAGKSILPSATKWRKRDHPRVCGEKEEDPKMISLDRGSPPRVRGKALINIKDVKQARITPACAGKSLWACL